MNVAFCIDKNYFRYFIVALKSFAVNNISERYNIYFVHNGISAKEKNILIKFIKENKLFISEIVVNDFVFNDLCTNYHFTKAMYYRLLLQDLLPEKINKVLYLDADLLVVGDVSELFDFDIENYFVAAIEEPNFRDQNRLMMKPTSSYFNSGVMLINLEAWRKVNLKDMIIEFVKKNKNIIEMPDQDALNASIEGRCLFLPPIFNQQTVFFESQLKFSTFTSDELLEAKKKPKIIHFTGSSKPWHFRNHHPFKHLYWKYLRMTPYKYFIPPDLMPLNILKELIPRKLKDAVKKCHKHR